MIWCAGTSLLNVTRRFSMANSTIIAEYPQVRMWLLPIHIMIIAPSGKCQTYLVLPSSMYFLPPLASNDARTGGPLGRVFWPLQYQPLLCDLLTLVHIFFFCAVKTCEQFLYLKHWWLSSSQWRRHNLIPPNFRSSYKQHRPGKLHQGPCVALATQPLTTCLIVDKPSLGAVQAFSASRIDIAEGQQSSSW